ncbi:MAG: ribonuclease HII [Candidatus Omnitrophica bacterium]|nr:ribonuclease HII [Candidatus Omnitrophota bacterium]
MKIKEKDLQIAVAGVDEAGRGALAGPVVASVVFLSSNVSVEGVTDSKMLSSTRRSFLFSQIIEKGKVGIGIINEGTIDEINILQASLRAMEQAFLDLNKKETIKHLFVDGPIKPNVSCPCTQIIGGDKTNFHIGAASIVAKVVRDRIMSIYSNLFPRYGFAKHKGYATKTHLKALDKHGPCPIHRCSYSPVKKRMKK